MILALKWLRTPRREKQTRVRRKKNKPQPSTKTDDDADADATAADATQHTAVTQNGAKIGSTKESTSEQRQR